MTVDIAGGITGVENYKARSSPSRKADAAAGGWRLGRQGNQK